jgi:hypothetical protein
VAIGIGNPPQTHMQQGVRTERVGFEPTVRITAQRPSSPLRVKSRHQYAGGVGPRGRSNGSGRIMPLASVVARQGRVAERVVVSAFRTLGTGFEITNRKDGLRFFNLTARTAATNSLKAVRFIVAMLQLW